MLAMFRLVAHARLSAAFLFALWRVNRSACAASRIRDCFGCGGGGRLGDNLINQTISVLGKFAEVRAKNIKKLWKMLEINRIL
jgi:hypothetical protein